MNPQPLRKCRYEGFGPAASPAALAHLIDEWIRDHGKNRVRTNVLFTASAAGHSALLEYIEG
jgi:hypothetical protein